MRPRPSRAGSRAMASSRTRQRLLHPPEEPGAQVPAALAGPLLRAPWAPQVSPPLPPFWGACPCPWDLSPGPLLCPWIWPSPTTAWIWERPVAKPPIASPDLFDPGLARVHHTASAYSCFLLPHTRGKSAHWLLPTACTVHKANSLRQLYW